MSNHAADSSSASHGHAPQRPEVTHPVLWTLGLLVGVAIFASIFAKLFHVGQQHAKGEPKIEIAKAGGGEPDHKALMADHGQAVLDQGEILFGKNCASCHGPAGDSNPNNINPQPRNFKTEAFKNPNGGGPWGFYSVLTEGYGAGMPAFRNLTPQERWAVVTFVRESWMKPANPHFVAKDKADIEAKIPAAGASGGASAEVDPRAVPSPVLLASLMAGWSAQTEVGLSQDKAWLEQASVGMEGTPLAPAFARLQVLAENQPVRIARVKNAVVRDDRELAIAALVNEDGAGSADPVFSLLPNASINAVWDRLRATPFASGAVK